MNPQTIRRIDLWIGKPVCLALTLLRHLASPLRPRGHALPPPRKILFIKLIEQGATVLAYRAIARAVELVGRENVYFWVFAENRPILDLMDLIPAENVIEIRGKRLVPLLWDMLASLWRIRRLGIDATIDMELFARASAILAFLTGARHRVGLHRFTTEGPYRGDLLTHRVQYNPYQHTAAMYYLLVQSLQQDPRQHPLPQCQLQAFDGRPPRFLPDEQEVLAVRQILSRLAPSPRNPDAPLVLLNPNASDLLPLRKWPTERFIELGRRLLEDDPDLTIALTGAPSERAPVEAVAKQIGPDRVISLAGHTTMRQLMVLYTIADVLVTNDSGPGHFASMTPIDTVVLFGPETPALYTPLGEHTHVIWANLACSPCVNAMNHRFSPCQHNLCMQAITVDQVFDQVKALLQQRHTTRQQSPLEAVASDARQ